MLILIHRISICDVTGKGSFPSRIEGASLYTRSTQGPALNSGGGFLSFLFTADDLYCLDLAISLAHSSEGTCMLDLHGECCGNIAHAISCE